ncbi:MAG: hypothetical protein ISS80_06290 [Candidatus Cloacimonetes bacterium]|nr:hypothetical protein [Candidatus Cloacimonadota bacterium]
MNRLENIIDINKRKGFPRVYRFNQFIRWFTLSFGTLAIVYSFWLIFTKVNADSSKFQQFVPFAIMFLALNSVFRNLFSLNSIRFQKDAIAFRYLLRKSVKIPWVDIFKIELNDSKRKMIRLLYINNGEEKNFEFTINFPDMLEIVNSIAEMNPNIKYDEFIEKVIITPQEKEQIQKKQVETSKQEQKTEEK